MAKSTLTNKTAKRMGRPPLGVDVLLGVKVSPEMLLKIEAWAKKRKLSKSEAVRQLLSRALEDE